MSIQRAISIRQPFVELILRGEKREEYRSRPTRIRERVYLYASQQPFESDAEWAKVGVAPGALPVGLILGSVEIVDCQPDRDGDGYAYVLRNPQRLASPLKASNQPQPVFWRPEFDASASGGRRAVWAVKKEPTAASRRRDKSPDVLLTPSPELAAIVGVDPLRRQMLVKKLWSYIQENHLQDDHDQRLVHADARLRRLFGKPQVTLYEMASLLGQHVA